MSKDHASGDAIRGNILNYIIAFKREHDGNSPTIRQITDKLKISSTSVTYYHIQRMFAKGIVKDDSSGYIIPGGKWDIGDGKDGSNE